MTEKHSALELGRSASEVSVTWVALPCLRLEWLSQIVDFKFPRVIMLLEMKGQSRLFILRNNY